MRVIEKKKGMLSFFNVDVAAIDPKQLFVKVKRTQCKHGVRFNRRLCSEIMADDAKIEDTKLSDRVFTQTRFSDRNRMKLSKYRPQ